LPGVVAAAVDRGDLGDESVTFRFGLHWGARLYVGQSQTAGRSEVTALGDEVNDAARIEACASGGRTLASKDLLESLTVVRPSADPRVHRPCARSRADPKAHQPSSLARRRVR